MKFQKRLAVKITLIYLFIVVFWILVTDHYLLGRQKESTDLQHDSLQTITNISFALIIGAFIYILVHKSSRTLAQSAEEYQALFMNNPNPMWIYDLETLAFLKVNKAATEKYGYSTEEFLSMTLKDIRRPEDLETLMHYLNNLTDKLSEARIWQHLKKDGHILTVQATNYFIEFRGRKCRLAVCCDVTDRQVLEQSLLKSNTEMQMLINGITDGFFIVNRDFNIIRCNKELNLISGREHEELEGKNLYDIFPESRNQFSHTEYLNSFATRKAVHFENYNVSLKAWYRVSAYPFENYLSVFFRDISKEKESELKIIQNEQNLFALINNTEDLIWSIDLNFNYYTFNKQYKNMFYQYFQEDIWPGKCALLKKTTSFNCAGCKGYYERALSGETFSIDMELTHPEGRTVHAHICYNPITNDKNEVVGVGCSLQDVTESMSRLKKIETQNKKLRNIAYVISHTVRAPLANILGLSAAIDRNNVVNVNDLKYLEYIDYSAHQLDHIIKDIVSQTIQIEEEVGVSK